MNGWVASPYAAWNDALGRRFFHDGAAGQQVYLYVTEEVIAEVGRSIGGSGVTEFVDVVRSGPPGATRTGHCQRALQVARAWRDQGLLYPPYLAYLALFVLAGGHEGDFAPHAYYPRLWELLGEQGEASPPSFDRMLDLWDDLERWSTHDLDGQLGVFEANIVGGWIHVGLPLAQTVLTESERTALPRVFAQAQLEPGVPPSSSDLQRALVQQGRHVLRPRTVSALERGADSFKRALLDIVADDFLAWDGESPSGGSADQPNEVQAGLRICLAVDRVAGYARATIRCHSKRDLPEDGLMLERAATRFQCGEYVPRWSSSLVDASTGEHFEPPPTAWSAGMVLVDQKRGWKARLRTARLRIFVDGTSDGLPDLVEVTGVPLHRPFYVAFQSSDWPTLREWSEQDCTGWTELAVVSGLPAGWTLVTISGASTDRGARLVDPSVAYPDRVSVRTEGGIRSSTAGNAFFAFAPPRVVVDGRHADDVVYCNERAIEADPDAPGTYVLPGDLPTDTRIAIDVRRGEDTIRRLSVYLVSGFSWRFSAPLVAVDRFGSRLEDATASDGIVGARIPAAEELLDPDLLRVPGMGHASKDVIFIGNRVGAIAVWPAEPFPPWAPVWAVPFGRRGRAVYCAPFPAAARLSKERLGNRKSLTRWHQVLWEWRRQITPPPDPHLKELWRRYRESARDA